MANKEDIGVSKLDENVTKILHMGQQVRQQTRLKRQQCQQNATYR